MQTNEMIHVLSGDSALCSIIDSGMPGEFLAWHDINYDGPIRSSGYPNEQTLEARAEFIEKEVGAGLSKEYIMQEFHKQYGQLIDAVKYNKKIMLWFDACLFDQAMLIHILMCLQEISEQQNKSIQKNVSLFVIDKFEGIIPYHGTGQLTTQNFSEIWQNKTNYRAELMTEKHYIYAKKIDTAFAEQNFTKLLTEQLFLDECTKLFPHVIPAIQRWISENPPKPQLGRLATLALAAIQAGNRTPFQIFKAVAQMDTPPQYWGDTTLWKIINQLADQRKIRIEGPENRLPQWNFQEKQTEIFDIFPEI